MNDWARKGVLYLVVQSGIWGPPAVSQTPGLDAKTLAFGLHCPLVARLVCGLHWHPGYSWERAVALLLGQAPELPSKSLRSKSAVPVNFLSIS